MKGCSTFFVLNSLLFDLSGGMRTRITYFYVLRFPLMKKNGYACYL